MNIPINEVLTYLKQQDIPFYLRGQENGFISGFSSLLNYRDGCLTWAKTASSLSVLPDHTCIRAIIAQNDVSIAVDYSKCVIFSSESKRAFFSIIEHFSPEESSMQYKCINTCISEKAKVGKNVRIGNNCFIGADVEIGDGTIIGNNVSIESRTHIGSNCSIFSGAIIGSPGFGLYFNEESKLKRARHFGGVWIDDNVEIGDNCVINRGSIDNTYIGSGTKINSLLQIPHNVHIGQNCIIIGGMGGSCEIGDESYLAPNSFVKNQVKVGRHCMVNCFVFLTEDLPDGYVAHKDRKLRLDYRRIINL